jgi:DNA-binding transcriptional MerR regulator
MSNQGRSMSIGAVAAQAGRRPSSIRYYEQIGLLPRPDRVSGRRVYGPDTVRTLAVIETGQRAGLTLDEIRDLLSASDGDQAAIERLREVAVRKLGIRPGLPPHLQPRLMIMPGGHPGRTGGLWLWMILVLSLFQAVVVPSGFRTTVQPHW